MKKWYLGRPALSWKDQQTFTEDETDQQWPNPCSDDDDGSEEDDLLPTINHLVEGLIYGTVTRVDEFEQRIFSRNIFKVYIN